MRFVEWFVKEKLQQFQAHGATPTIPEIREIINAVFAGTTDWQGPLPLSVAEAFINAFSMLCDTAEEINWSVDSCPQEISPITTTHVLFSLLGRSDGLTGSRYQFHGRDMAP